MNRDVKKILVMLAFYSLSAGLLYNFQELWMAENNLTVKTISILYSLCAFLTVTTIIVISNILKQNKIRGFILFLMFIKVFMILFMFLLNSSNSQFWIKFFIMLDYIVDVEILISIYPLLTIIEKNDKVFAKKGLIYSFFYYVGAIITTILLNKYIGFIQIDYNFYLLLSSISLVTSFIILITVKTDKYLDNIEDKKDDIVHELIIKIKKDKISINYLLYIFTGNISFYAINSLVLTLLVSNLNIIPHDASLLLLVLGIGTSIVGMLILSKFTLKNNYVNIGIKFFGRLVSYLLVVLFPTKIIILISIMYTRILSESYTHITDAPYINRFSNDLQLSFCNLKSMVGYASRGIGTYICGIAIVVSVKLAYLIALVFCGIQIYFAYRALYLKNKECLHDR